jgi:hypothetical protein
MPGLIEDEASKVSTDNVLEKDFATATTTKIDPAQHTVNAGLETVSGQLDKVLSNDSPVLQRARARSTETANSRGLVNSTMAAQAGEAAVIDAAMPIAAADANVYNTSSMYNTQAQNAALTQNAAESNVTSRVNAGAANQQGNMGYAAELEGGLIELRGNVESALQELRGGQAVQLANIEAQYKQLMQANSSVASLFTESMQQLSSILRDPTTSAAQKESATTAQMQLLESSLAAAGAISNMDLLALLDFGEEAP